MKDSERPHEIGGRSIETFCRLEVDLIAQLCLSDDENVAHNFGFFLLSCYSCISARSCTIIIMLTLLYQYLIINIINITLYDNKFSHHHTSWNLSCKDSTS